MSGEQTEHREPTPVVLCLGGPYDRQGYTPAEWAERREAADNMSRVDDRPRWPHGYVLGQWRGGRQPVDLPHPLDEVDRETRAPLYVVTPALWVGYTWLAQGGTEAGAA